MPKIKLPYLSSDVDRHGNRRFYFRKKGQKKIRLLGKPGTYEFMESYKSASKNPVLLEPTVVKLLPKESFGYVCKQYFNSSVFKKLDGSTQNWRRRALEAICVDFGEANINELKPFHINNLIESKSDKPGSANNTLKALKALFVWALPNGLCNSDPAKPVKKIKYHSDGWHTWTNLELQQFRLKHAIGSQARLALELLVNTACRREDVVRLGPTHLVDGRFEFIQAKNEHRNPVAISVPATEETVEAIRKARTGKTTFLATEYDKPFSPDGFGNKFAGWCEEAGLVHCTMHGLRKYVATELANGGATAHQIMAVTGHQTLAEVDRYTKRTAQKTLADSAFEKLKANKKSPTSKS